MKELLTKKLKKRDNDTLSAIQQVLGLDIPISDKVAAIRQRVKKDQKRKNKLVLKIANHPALDFINELRKLKSFTLIQANDIGKKYGFERYYIIELINDPFFFEKDYETMGFSISR